MERYDTRVTVELPRQCPRQSKPSEIHIGNPGFRKHKGSSPNRNVLGKRDLYDDKENIQTMNISIEDTALINDQYEQ